MISEHVWGKKDKIKEYKKIQTKYISRRITKNERIHERIQKNLFQQCVQKIKENNEDLKSIEVDVVTNFNKDKIKRFFDAEVYTNDDDYDADSEEDRAITFR